MPSVTEWIGPSALIKLGSKLAAPSIAEYEPKPFRGMPTSVMKLFTSAARAQERPASAPLQGNSQAGVSPECHTVAWNGRWMADFS